MKSILSVIIMLNKDVKMKVLYLLVVLPLLIFSAFAQEGKVESVDSASEEIDNSRCHVCHINFAFDDLAVKHEEVNVGCETCHGSSDSHCSDEDNIIPPDIMWPLASLNSKCMECHEQAKLPKEEHTELFSEASEDVKVCTDCHGDHRLPHRTRRWNRETGELIESDAVRMLNDEERKFMEE
jgi:hypothetical protein